MYRALDDIHKEYQHFYVTEPQSSLCDLPISGRVESADRTRLRHFLQYPTMLICRLRATLSLSEADRAMGEEEAQRFAARTLLIEKMARAVDPVMAWQLAQRNNLPYSIVRTREDWLSINERGENWEELKTFLKQRWLKWEYYWEDEILIKELGQVPIEE
ncbi:hypothetical protein GL218_05181 [Daldinia childiae]|uniref:uncharacterized protein n=1 Tax=Daldinia childiae TaxID=326645 RepID=UPI001445F7D0|nr:uncharacterized protein GL218_05181 [Daldinia childiae]KAF3058422.1 hypothetical protein GL218_05181 [Daldinia childiae]